MTSGRQQQVDLWRVVITRLSALVGEDTVQRWFGEVTGRVETTEDEAFILLITAPNPFHGEWIQSHYSAQLHAIWHDIAPNGQVIFTAQPTPAPEPLTRLPAPVVQLPIWPDPSRGAPNSILRSALFAAIQGKRRRYMKKELLGSVQGVTIRFTGYQLDQSDLDVWEQAVHLARRQPLGHVCYFRANAMLKALGRHNGKGDYVWLDDVITRLVACAVEIRHGRKVFTGSLLSSCHRDEETGIYKLTLDPDTIKLYGGADWTAVEWTQRQALRGKPLALWLQGFYASHAAPYPIKIATLHRLSGSQTKELWKFKQNLKTALVDLQAVTGMQGAIDGEFDLMERQPSPPQARHLIRKLSGQKKAKTTSPKRGKTE